MESGQKFAEALPQEDFVLQVIFGSAVQCHTYSNIGSSFLTKCSNSFCDLYMLHTGGFQ